MKKAILILVLLTLFLIPKHGSSSITYNDQDTLRAVLMVNNRVVFFSNKPVIVKDTILVTAASTVYTADNVSRLKADRQ